MDGKNNILQLLTVLKQVSPTVEKLKPVHYKIKYNNFNDLYKYREYLETLYQKYRNEIAGLPLSHSDKEARRTFYNNILQELSYTKEHIQEQVTQKIIPRFQGFNEFKSTNNRKKRGLRSYKNKVQHEVRKLRIMIQIQSNYTEKALQYIENKLNNHNPINGATNTKKIETHYSGKILTSIIKLIVKILSTKKDYSKTDLTKIAASLFTSKKSISLNEDYLYNNFTRPLTEKEQEELKAIAIQFLNESSRMKDPL